MFLRVITICLIAFLVSAAAAEFHLPRNTKEKDVIERFFDWFDPDADFATIVVYLRVERQRKLQLAKELEQDQSLVGSKRQEELREARFQADLLEQYVNVTELSLDKCKLEDVTECALRIKFHEGAEQLLRYLRNYAAAQYGVCKAQWDSLLLKEVEQQVTKPIQIHWLMDSLMQARKQLGFNDNKRLTPSQSEKLYRYTAKAPRSAGLVEFMARIGDLEVDKRLKNDKITWTKFLEAAQHTLVPLCSHLCRQLSPATQVYKFAFEPRLEIPTIRQSMRNQKREQEALQWLVYITLACKIEQSSVTMDGILREAFVSLKSQ